MTGVLNVLVAAVGSLRNVMVAGVGSGFTGYNPGTSTGSLTPNTDIAGRTIGSIGDAGGTQLQYVLGGLGSDPTQSAFTALTITGAAGLKNFASASATYSYNSSAHSATWTWTGTYGFAGGNTYQLQAR